MKVISSNLPKGRFQTCPYPVLLPLHGVVKANWYYMLMTTLTISSERFSYMS